MTPEQQLHRASRAREILDNEVFQQAMQGLKDEFVKGWVNSPARDANGKDYFWRLYKSAEKFEAALRGYVETGKLAKETIQRQRNFIGQYKE